MASLRITAEDISRLRKALVLGQQLAADGKDTSAISGKVPIHDIIYSIADNSLLEQMLLSLKIRWAWYASPLSAEKRHRSWNEHVAIVEAIIAGRGDAAIEAMRIHNANAHENYLMSMG